MNEIAPSPPRNSEGEAAVIAAGLRSGARDGRASGGNVIGCWLLRTVGAGSKGLLWFAG